MAEIDDGQFLLSLEDELTCSICLSTFDCPVTIPCGHNFCQDCLLETWRDSYSCPQCRTVFPTKPELKKNTVISSVVENLNTWPSKNEVREESEAVKHDVIRCDTCMEAEASRTCLTCMASFCDKHLRPHRENPIFRLHQLSEPVGDLLERICQDHHKLMEFFCNQHGRPICSTCLQQVHKGCPFVSPEEQRSAKESDLRGKLGLLEKKIARNKNVISQMRDMQNNLKDQVTMKFNALTTEFQQMRDLLDQVERDALTAVQRELETGQNKLEALIKKFTENIDSMSSAEEEIRSLLSQSRTLAFLQVSFDLPRTAKFDPQTPQISLDSKKVTVTEAFVFALKEHLMEIFKEPVECRLLRLKPELPQQKDQSTSHGPAGPPVQPHFQPVPLPVYKEPHEGWNPSRYPQDRASGSSRGPPWLARQKTKTQWAPGLPRSHSPDCQPRAGPKKNPQKPTKKGLQFTKDNMHQTRSVEDLLQLDVKDKPRQKLGSLHNPSDVTSDMKRSTLLKYATVFYLDPKTAHKRIALSDGFTKAFAVDEHLKYPDTPDRFAVCSQVLAARGFSRGRHYWEARLSKSSFMGIGLAYSSIDRKGPTSRLGRNAQSWCVEWFNDKLSAWYNNKEKILANPSPKRVGVLLDCEEGTATFYNVADRAYPFHSFVFPFAEAVYPAFWIFSSGLSISLCKLQA